MPKEPFQSQRDNLNSVWIRTELVEAVIRNNGSLPKDWKPSRKRSRTNDANDWGWTRAELISSSCSAAAETTKTPTKLLTPTKHPFGQVQLKRTPPPKHANLPPSPKWSLTPERNQPIGTQQQQLVTFQINDTEYAGNFQGITIKVQLQPHHLEQHNLICRVNAWTTSRQEPPDDLTALTHLHEPAVVYCLQHRYRHDRVYTYTGKILLALNPFRPLPHLYGLDVMQRYWKSPKRQPPHVYQIAQDAYTEMQRFHRNQTMLVSGESGAGKTVTTKIVMQYLAALQQEHNTTMEAQVLQSNPILESFGNARTVRNDNSSRFGKFIQISFDKGRLVSASIQTYLLEKVRLVTQAPEERNFHIFYELMVGLDAHERQLLHMEYATPDDFVMTCKSITGRRDGVQDKDTYQTLRSALTTVGFSKQEQFELFEVACALLHTSNIEFCLHNDACQMDITQPSLQAAVDLLGVDVETLNNAICFCAIQARGEVLYKRLNVAQAQKAIEALIKATYGALFVHIVRTMNGFIAGQEPRHSSETSFIGLLDIFGFESFETNSFEQLCINYCNEALQQQFNRFVFKLEQEEYHREGIEWSFISFPDNQQVLDLIERKYEGIFSILDEQCRLPQSQFARAVYDKCSSHPRFQATHSQRVRSAFSIHHYAGWVEYHSEDFLEKNKDELPKETTELLLSSSRPFLAHLGQILSETTVSSNSTRRLANSSSILRESVGSQFSGQLGELRDRIQGTDPHYVRCLKPNDDLVPHQFHPMVISDQLRCAGVLEAIRVSRVGFPHRFFHSVFLERYGLLARKPLERIRNQRRVKPTEQEICKVLVDAVMPLISQVLQEESTDEETMQPADQLESVALGMQMGKSKVFLRRRCFESLEFLRDQKLHEAAVKIQSMVRRMNAELNFEISLIAILVIQASVRKFLATRYVEALRWDHGALVIQCYWRRYWAYLNYQAAMVIALWGQSTLMGIKTRRLVAVLKWERKAVCIQNCWRSHNASRSFRRLRKAAVQIQCRYRMRQSIRVLKRLKIEARDIRAIAAERDKFRQESLALRRKLQDAEKPAKTEKAKPVSSEELAELKEEIRRLKRELAKEQGARSPPSTVTSEDEYRSLADECARKDQELATLREQLSRVRGQSTVPRGRSSPRSRTSPVETHSQASSWFSQVPNFFKKISPRPLENATEAPSPFRAASRQFQRPSSPFPRRSSGSLTCDAIPSIPFREAESPFRQRRPRNISTHSTHSLLDTDEPSGWCSSDQPEGSPMRCSDLNESFGFYADEEAAPEEKTAPFDLFDDNLKSLREMVLEDDIETVTNILSNCGEPHVLINECDEEGRSPLHMAALVNNVEMAKLLVENGAVVNIQDVDGETPLHLSLDARMATVLLTDGMANPNIPNIDGICALHLAVQRRDLATVRILLRHGVDVNVADNVKWFTPLHLIALPPRGCKEDEIPDGVTGQIAHLLCGASSGAGQPDLNYQDSEGNTPLHYAVQLANNDACELVNIFLEKGQADANISNERYQTPLLLLCHNDDLRKLDVFQEILHEMLSHGADPNRPSTTGCTALHLSLFYRDIDSSIQLVSSGADLHLAWKKPKSWVSFWNDMGSSDVLPLDMVVDEQSLYRILAAITRPQNWAPSRKWCMHCMSLLGTFSRAIHCRHCSRLVCGKCSRSSLGPEFFPKTFDVEDNAWVCTTCERILVTRKEDDSNSTQPISSFMEDDDDRAYYQGF